MRASELKLAAADVSFAYPPGPPVVRQVSLSLTGGQTTALIALNGAGKSRLAMLLGGLLSPTAGRVLLGGQDLAGMALGQLARSVGFVFQDPDLQIFSPTTRHEIAFGPANLLHDQALAKQRTDEALDRFGLGAVAELPPASLSYGLRRKLTVAAVYTMRPQFLLLDEPTRGLDPGSATNLMEALDGLRASGHGLLLLTHDLDLVARYSQTCALMAAGRLLAYGPTTDVLLQADALQAAGLKPPPMARIVERLAAEGRRARDLTIPAVAAAILALAGEPHP